MTRREFTGLDPAVAANLERVRERIADAGGDPDDVEICAAIKYVPVDELGALAEGGITVVGENRAQDLAEKHERSATRSRWDFIGELQSRKVKDVAPLVRLIHSVASESALRKLEANPAPRGADRGERRGEESRPASTPPTSAASSHECPVP